MKKIKDYIDDSFLNIACSILGDTNEGLSGSEIVKYSNKFAFEFNVEIPVSHYPWGDFGKDVPNKRTGLYRNLVKFSPQQQFYIINYLCNLSEFENNTEVRDLNKKLIENYSQFAPKNLSDNNIVSTTLNQLDDYLVSKSLFDKAIHLYETKGDSRNILDNARLSLELFLKEFFGNKKSLENQVIELGQFLKRNGISKEIRNLFSKVLDYYIDYQNTHVKHNNTVNKFEIEYLLYQTAIMISFLANLKNEFKQTKNK